MSAINFPDSPSVNDLYTAANGSVYKWNGTYWAVVSATAATEGTTDYPTMFLLMGG